MAKKIVITALAQQNYEGVINYLQTEWSSKEAQNFIDRFEQVCNYLIENPEIYPFVSRSRKMQRCVLTKQNIVYFRNDNDVIVILDIFDTRQDPKKLKVF